MTDKEIEAIAYVAHAANRAYCSVINDKMCPPIWECTSREHRESMIQGVKTVLADPEIPASTAHMRWCEYKVKKGWKRGLKKSDQKKEHPNLVPFDDLPKDQQKKSRLFRLVVISLSQDV